MKDIILYLLLFFICAKFQSSKDQLKNPIENNTQQQNKINKINITKINIEQHNISKHKKAKQKNNKQKQKQKTKKESKKNINKHESKKEKTLNLTESLINFYNDYFNNSNKINGTLTEENKKQLENFLEDQIKTKEAQQNHNKIREKIGSKKTKKIEKERQKKSMKKIKEREKFQKWTSNLSFSDTFEICLEKKNSEKLYLNITNEPSIIYIGFILTDSEKEINFIFSKTNKNGVSSKINSVKNKNCYFLEYSAEEKGEYTIFLENKNSDKINVILFMKESIEENTNDNLQAEKLDKIFVYLKNIDNNINEMRTKQNIVNKQVETHNNRVNENNKKIVMYAIIEIFTMLIVFFAQSSYIKRIVLRL